jgi:hypothetical protein
MVEFQVKDKIKLRDQLIIYSSDMMPNDYLQQPTYLSNQIPTDHHLQMFKMGTGVLDQ